MTNACFAGTSDEHLSLLEHLAPLQDRLSSVVVTTPQAVALSDALKCISFTRATALPVRGLVENMSGYVCPCCGEITNIFSTGGGASLAERENIPFLGSLPIDSDLVTLLDAASDSGTDGSSNNDVGEATGTTSGFPLLERYQKTQTWPLFKIIVQKAMDHATSESA